MALRTRISLVLAFWFACEAIAFTLVVDQIGLGAAVLVGIMTSMVGASLLKQTGRSALARLRRGVGAGGLQDGRGTLRGTLALDDTLAGIGAVLLLLPGFIGDVVGLALATPILRRWIGASLGTIGLQGAAGLRRARGQPRAQHGPAVIDLEPDEWRPTDEGRPRTQS